MVRTERYRTVKLEKRDNVAYITLNRPEVLNAISEELLLDLRSTLEEIEKIKSMKAVVLTGAGRAFSAGADLKHIEDAATNPASFRDFEGLFYGVVSALENFPLPLVVAVNGPCFAGGLEIMLACDLAIAAETAKIGDQHINFGLIGGPASWQLLSRVGWQKACELLTTGRWLSGKEAESYGLVLKAVPREQLDEEVEKLVSHLRDKSRPALIAYKRLLRAACEIPSRDKAREFARNLVFQYFVTEKDPKEGIKAFLEKRKPST